MSVVPLSNNEPLICNNEKMRYRPFGKTGLMISALSFGCMRLSGDMDLNEKLISKAIDDGINYFDVAPSYWDGEAEEKLGKALQPYRKNIFLACKTMERSANGAKKELDGKNLVYSVDVLDGVLAATGNECSLFIDPVGRPASPTSVAGVARRSTRRHVAAATH